MENKKRYCSICGKENPRRYIEFIDQYVYINCACEEEKQKKEKEKKRKKAIEAYLNLRSQSSHVQLREREADLATLKVDKCNENAIDIARFISDMLLADKEKENEKNGVILKGNRGSGKTYIACAIINEINKKLPLNEQVIERIIKEHNNGFFTSLDVSVCSPCKIIKEDDLIRLYGKYDFRTEVTPLDEYKKAKKLLVIDDLGTAATELKKTQSAFFNIIDYRYSNKLPTVITTNMNNAELKNYLGERTYDRLNACCFSINLTSEESRRGGSN